jgi:hypothetical protein
VGEISDLWLRRLTKLDTAPVIERVRPIPRQLYRD